MLDIPISADYYPCTVEKSVLSHEGGQAGGLRVLLIANYENDRQESMLRFAGLLRSELGKADVTVELVSPSSYFGALKPAATGLGKWLGYLDKFLIFPFALVRRLRSMRGGDVVVHICDHSNAIYTRWLKGIPHMVTCNDLLAIRSAGGDFSENRVSFTGKCLQRWICRGLVRARRITCISEATRQDLLRLPGIAPSKVDVTYMGLNPAYAPMPRAQALAQVEKLTSSSAPYILHVGGGQWYKNRPGVLGIHAALRNSGPVPRLVMVGPAMPDAPPDVLFLTGVDNEALCALYSAAELLLFPSLEEGFGWPIVEAQACGCRVVTTRKAPMTEVGGDAAIYLPEREHGSRVHEWMDSAALVVKDVLEQDDAVRSERITLGLQNARRFTAEAMARRYLAIYKH